MRENHLRLSIIPAYYERCWWIHQWHSKDCSWGKVQQEALQQWTGQLSYQLSGLTGSNTGLPYCTEKEPQAACSTKRLVCNYALFSERDNNAFETRQLHAWISIITAVFSIGNGSWTSIEEVQSRLSQWGGIWGVQGSQLAWQIEYNKHRWRLRRLPQMDQEAYHGISRTKSVGKGSQAQTSKDCSGDGSNISSRDSLLCHVQVLSDGGNERSCCKCGEESDEETQPAGHNSRQQDTLPTKISYTQAKRRNNILIKPSPEFTIIVRTASNAMQSVFNRQMCQPQDLEVCLSASKQCWLRLQITHHQLIRVTSARSSVTKILCPQFMWSGREANMRRMPICLVSKTNRCTRIKMCGCDVDADGYNGENDAMVRMEASQWELTNWDGRSGDAVEWRSMDARPWLCARSQQE